MEFCYTRYINKTDKRMINDIRCWISTKNTRNENHSNWQKTFLRFYSYWMFLICIWQRSFSGVKTIKLYTTSIKDNFKLRSGRVFRQETCAVSAEERVYCCTLSVIGRSAHWRLIDGGCSFCHRFDAFGHRLGGPADRVWTQNQRDDYFTFLYFCFCITY